MCCALFDVWNSVDVWCLNLNKLGVGLFYIDHINKHTWPYNWCMLTDAWHIIPFTQPDSNNPQTQPGWNEFVASDFDHAMHWRRIYVQYGCPQSGFIYQVRKLTQSMYHKQVKFINKQKQKKIRRDSKCLSWKPFRKEWWVW